jgi:hypothetical protein
MENYCASLYRKLQRDIAACKTGDLPCARRVEYCFGLAVTQWMELSKKLRHHHFASEENEIRFFKILKPKITAEIEYYSFVYHALLFQPDEGDALILFWRREYERLERFKTANPDFIRCYEADHNERQPWFFLRKYYIKGNAADAHIYDADAALSTNGDGLTATLLALLKYNEYVKVKLETL